MDEIKRTHSTRTPRSTERACSLAWTRPSRNRVVRAVDSRLTVRPGLNVCRIPYRPYLVSVCIPFL